MHGPIAGVGVNIKKRLPKCMDWEVATTVVHTIKNIFNSIKLNLATFEKWMLSQAVEDLLKLYVSMLKFTVPEEVQK